MEITFKLWVIGTIVATAIATLLWFIGLVIAPQTHFSFLECWAIINILLTLHNGKTLFSESKS